MSIVLIASIFGYRNGVFAEVYEADFTKLSVVLAALFTYMSIWCGVKTWQLSQFLDTYDTNK